MIHTKSALHGAHKNGAWIAAIVMDNVNLIDEPKRVLTCFFLANKKYFKWPNSEISVEKEMPNTSDHSPKYARNTMQRSQKLNDLLVAASTNRPLTLDPCLQD